MHVLRHEERPPCKPEILEVLVSKQIMTRDHLHMGFNENVCSKALGLPRLCSPEMLPKQITSHDPTFSH